MGKNFKHVVVRPDVKEMIEQARKEYLKHHPELKHVFLSDNKVLYEVLRYYLD